MITYGLKLNPPSKNTKIKIGNKPIPIAEMEIASGLIDLRLFLIKELEPVQSKITISGREKAEKSIYLMHQTESEAEVG